MAVCVNTMVMETEVAAKETVEELLPGQVRGSNPDRNAMGCAVSLPLDLPVCYTCI